MSEFLILRYTNALCLRFVFFFYEANIIYPCNHVFCTVTIGNNMHHFSTKIYSLSYNYSLSLSYNSSHFFSNSMLINSLLFSFCVSAGLQKKYDEK